MQKTPPYPTPAKQYPDIESLKRSAIEKYKKMIARSRKVPQKAFALKTPHGVVRYFLSYGVPPGISGPVRESTGCRECIRRLERIGGFCGPDGSVLSCFCKCGSPVMQNTCNIARKFLEEAKKTEWPKIEICGDKDDFGYEVSKGGYDHITPRMKETTERGLAEKWKRIISKYKDQMAPRLTELLEPGAVKSMVTISQIMQAPEKHGLKRRGHWSSVVDWISAIQKKAGGRRYAAMSPEEQVHFTLYAMGCGRVDGGVLLDFHQSDNVLDFMKKGGSVPGVVALMNSRSDPRTYMVSQAAKALADHNVKCRHTVVLIWDTIDDLDLHVVCNGLRCYYSKQVIVVNGRKIKLEFDVNACKPLHEKNAVEAISFQAGIDGTPFEVYVDNFKSRTKRDVNFTVIIQQEGCDPIVFKKTWPTDRDAHDYMFVAKHSFAPLEPKPIVPSKGEMVRNKNKANRDLWGSSVGDDAHSVVPDFTDIVPSQEAPSHDDAPERNSAPRTTGDADETFAALMAGRQPVAADSRTWLCDKVVGTITIHELMVRLLRGGKVVINLTAHPPAYVTTVKGTAVRVTRTEYTICFYGGRRGAPPYPHPPHQPYTPSADDENQARFTPSWVGGTYETIQRHPVAAVVEINGVWFMVVKDGRLPLEDPQWPVVAGFYAPTLRPEYHSLRAKWAAYGQLIKPTISPNGSTPMIGCLCYSDMEVVVDGRPMTLVIPPRA